MMDLNVFCNISNISQKVCYNETNVIAIGMPTRTFIHQK